MDIMYLKTQLHTCVWWNNDKTKSFLHPEKLLIQLTLCILPTRPCFDKILTLMSKTDIFWWPLFLYIYYVEVLPINTHPVKIFLKSVYQKISVFDIKVRILTKHGRVGNIHSVNLVNSSSEQRNDFVSSLFHHKHGCKWILRYIVTIFWPNILLAATSIVPSSAPHRICTSKKHITYCVDLQ